MNKILFFVFIVICSTSNAQNVGSSNSIIPQPNFYQLTGGSIHINGKIQVTFKNNKFSSKESKSAEIFESAVNSITDSKKSNLKIEFDTTEKFPSKEAYKIEISANKILVSGQEEGLFYAVQTLLQFVPDDSSKKEIKFPCVIVRDQPRYGYRGLHLDVCRHFFSVGAIKDFITFF